MRQDLYQTVTDRIIAELEQGIVPWVQPWQATSGGPGISLPTNASTAKRYSGINILLLWDRQTRANFRADKWLTYKQAQGLGGNVKRGEHGTTIYFADKFIPQKERERAAGADDKACAVYFLKAYTVFNVEQCENLPANLMPSPVELVTENTMPGLVAAADALVKATGADFRIGGDRAFYAPSQDFIAIPSPAAYGETINWYRTAFHELGHWTGHEKRLNRLEHTAWGSPTYAREELVAEMSAAFTCAALGITPTVRHADYIGSWLQTLKEDNKAIFRAASAASKASDFVLAFGDAAPLELAA
jgi:antirestriction protein ArdC